MVTPIIQLYPVIPAKDEAEREALRPIGRNRERYQTTLTGWHDIIKAADELGIWGAATIEHHLWSEGYEVGPSPGILDGYWAAITKNIRVGQLGYVMSTQHPIRVAEEVAVLDHLTQGRCFVGFARGYQSRWTNILGQHLGARATRSPSAVKADPAAIGIDTVTNISDSKAEADDDINRRIFEEEIEIVLKAWQEDSIEHNGEFWQIPYPYETGVDDWQLAHAGVTGRLGAPGEVDADNSVRRISVVPAPYTKPHPPVFVASSASPETIEYCGRKGFNPVYFTSIDKATAMGHIYVEAANAAGRVSPLGQSQAIVRWIQIADSEEEARRCLLEYDSDIYKNFYAAMGRRRLTSPDDIVQSIVDSGLFVFGTADHVRDQLCEQWRRLPAEYIVLIFHYAQMPKERVIYNLTQFMKHVKPALDEIEEASRREASLLAQGPG
ncbi:MAG: LLM class flavin-dependent oxidoreductase [Chloroflexi bacterium]|nr:LLM class flavin-dependent oxidoreductase [Chloroflexota bacterium]